MIFNKIILKQDMKDKILFWIDAGLANFCIAKSLKENYDCDLFVIYDINEAKEFFQHQKIVEFEKKWFYRDCLNNKNHKTDFEYLKKFEEKYGINLWKLVYSDINFNEHNNYYKFKKNKILEILEVECRFLESVIEEAKPDFLIIRMTDYHQNQLIQMMCKAKGIRILTLSHARIGYRCIISQDTDFLDQDLIKKSGSYEEKSFKELQDHMKGYATQQKFFKKSYKNSNFKKAFASLKFLRLSTNKKYRLFFGNYGKTPLNVIKNEINLSLKKIIRKSFLNNHAEKNFKKESFVYFPLHLQPERSTLILSPFYTNQLEVIRNIAKSLPVEYKLYVKEHPIQGINSWREVSYYKEILQLPNVKLIHPSITNEQMIKESDLVMTITGTGGLEAALYEKPAIVFADVIYSKLESVFIVKNIEELPKLIKHALKIKVEIKDVNRYINLINENSFEFDLTHVFYTLIDDYFYYGGYLKESLISEGKMEKFLKENSKFFELVSNEHIKVIKNLKRNLN